MRQCGGFYIKPKENEHKTILADAIVEALDGLNFEGDNFWAECFNADKMEVDYETFIDMGDYEHAFIELCKEVAANLPKVAFEGISHYCNESAGFYCEKGYPIEDVADMTEFKI